MEGDLPAELREVLLPLVQMVETLSSCIALMTRESKNWPLRNIRIQSCCDKLRGWGR